MAKFEQRKREELKRALRNRGWIVIRDAIRSVAGQSHSWCLPGSAEGKRQNMRTLRNAAKKARLID